MSAGDRLPASGIGSGAEMMDPGRSEVSVVIPLFNKERAVERAIRSVVAQTFQEFEIVVVDDGSTDGGPDVVRKMADRRIRMLRQENAGVSAARNRGIAEAAADLIAFLDADDEWTPEFLETVIDLRERFPQCSVFATHYLFADGPGRFSRPVLRGLPSSPWQGVIEEYFGVAAISDCPICSSAVCVEKEPLESVGGFPVGVDSGEDLLTWAKLALQYQIAYTTRPCSLFWRERLAPGTLPRRPPIPDTVGEQLAELVDTVPDSQRADFGKYRALWHKMRASKYIAHGKRQEALREIGKAVGADRITGRLGLYALLAMLPSRLSAGLLNETRRAVRAFRSRARQNRVSARCPCPGVSSEGAQIGCQLPRGDDPPDHR